MEVVVGGHLVDQLERKGPMPRGSLHTETGLLLEEQHWLVLRLDNGGQWRIDPDRRVRGYVGRRVAVEGVRSGFDWLTVRAIREA